MKRKLPETIWADESDTEKFWNHNPVGGEQYVHHSVVKDLLKELRSIELSVDAANGGGSAETALMHVKRKVRAARKNTRKIMEISK